MWQFDDTWQVRIAQRYLMRWIACMLREINLVGCSYIDIIDMHIIENRQWGTSVPDNMEQAHTKMIGQADNEHLDISFICLLFSFLL
jgi:hypothetical protein